ncbi:hypothetical protein [Enterobacter hormaechei]|uniref:hypothetical protein n=1 Tax=Enterobacter hormaechei TaxID=158836 RepID=UPI003F41C9D9
MYKNRAFTIEDVKAYAESKGYDLEFKRYHKVFTLTNKMQPKKWGWIFFPHTEEKLVAKVNDLDQAGWRVAVDLTIERIEKTITEV